MSLVLLLGVLAVGCQPATAPAPARPSAPAATSPAAPAAPSPTAIPSPSSDASQPKYGGTVSYPLIAFPGGFDVHRKTSYTPFITIPVFSNLVRYDDQKPGLDPKNIVPDLADRWETSADGKTWTFFLHKGVKWHNGSPFTAADVVYSMQKMLDSKRSATFSSFPTVRTTEAVDDNTVRFILSEPSPSFLPQLTSAYNSIQSAKTAEIDPRTSDFLVGTGPFKFSKMTSGVSYELVRNPDYFKKDASGKQLPYLDGLKVYVIADRSAQADAFAAGRIDMTTPGPGVANDEQLSKFKSITAGMKVEFLPVKPVTNGNILFFNAKTGPTADARVRKAIALLADRKAMFTAGFGAESWGVFDYALMSPPYGLPTAEISKLSSWEVPYAQRVEQAKKLMADAGYAAGFKLKWPQNAVPEQQRRNYLLADMLRQHLKIECETTVYQTAELYTLRDTGGFGIIGQDSLSFLGDPNDLMGYFRSDSAGNFCGYKNAAVDALWVQQSQAMDLSKRIALCQDIERQILTDWPAIPLAFNGFVHAEYTYVKGFVPQNASYMSNAALERVWINK